MINVQFIRRSTLAHCLWMAQFDEAYARSAAADYERNPEYGGMFVGLLDRFDTDLSRRKADAKQEAADAAA